MLARFTNYLGVSTEKTSTITLKKVIYFADACLYLTIRKHISGSFNKTKVNWVRQNITR